MTLKIKYEDFVEKFKPKLTTDDCYTPKEVYNAILDWCVKEYGVDKNKVVRPFYPGGDYESFDYGDDSIVIDNPPFSILSQIVNFYGYYGIKFFLFAPNLTLFSASAKVNCTCLACNADITYENGVVVNTAFVTNLEDKEIAFRTVPDLHKILTVIDARLKKTKQLPKYKYPAEVITAAQLGTMAAHGIDFRVKRSECHWVRGLDAQRPVKKDIFGHGFLISKKKAAERLAAERAIGDEKICWELSASEREIIEGLQ